MSDEMVVKFTADINDLKAGVADVKRELGGVQDSAKSLSFIEAGESIKGLGQDLTSNVTMPVLGFFAESIEAASSTQESISKFAQIFKGDLAAQGESWIKGTADEMSRSSAQIRDYAASFGAVLGPQFSDNKAKALELSEGYTKLAVDLAAFYDVADEEAMVALRSALAGETEPMRRFGVMLSQAAVESELVAMGVGKVTSALSENQRAEIQSAQAAEDRANANLLALKASGQATDEEIKSAKAKYDSAKAHNDLIQLKYKDAIASDKKAAADGKVMKVATEAEKQQARYNIVMRQTADAQGQAARESDGYAQMMKATMAVVDDIKIEIGTMLMPVVLALLNLLKGGLELFKNIPGPIKTLIIVFAGLAAIIGPVLVVVGTLIGGFGSLLALIGTGGLTAAFGGLIAAISPFVAPVLAVVGAVAALAAGFYLLWTSSETFRTAVGNIVSLIMGALKAAFDWLMGGFKTLMTLIQPLAAAIGDLIGGLINQIVGWVRGEGQPFIAMLKTIADIIGGVLMGALKAYFGFLTGTWLPLLKEIAGKLLGAILDALRRLGEWFMSGGVQNAIGTIGDLLGGVWDALKKVGGIIADTVLGNLDKFMGIAGGVSKLLRGDVVGAFGDFSKALGIAGDGSGATATTVSTSMTKLADAVRTKIGDAKQWMANAWTDIKTGAGNKWREIRSEVENGLNNVRKGIEDARAGYVEAKRRTWEAINKAVGPAWTTIRKTVGEWVENTRDKIESYKKAFVDTKNRTWEAINAAVAPAWTTIRKTVGDWTENTRVKIESYKKAFVDTKNRTWEAINAAVAPAWTTIRTTVGTWTENLRAHIESYKQKFLDTLGRIWTAIKDAIPAAWEAIKSVAGTAAQQVVDKVGGILQGLVTKAQQVWNDMKAAVSKTIQMPSIQLPDIPFVGGGSKTTTHSDYYSTYSGGFIPSHHSGGIYRAPGNRDEGWAWLQSGERIIPKHEVEREPAGRRYDLSIQINNPQQKSVRETLQQARSTSRRIVRRIGVVGG